VLASICAGRWSRRPAALLGLRNVKFVNGGIEKLPLPDGSVDVVISNGVFNLCPDKPGMLAASCQAEDFLTTEVSP
jgi:hypothetical protein